MIAVSLVVGVIIANSKLQNPAVANFSRLPRSANRFAAAKAHVCSDSLLKAHVCSDNILKVP